eukprot:jgi/Bigna1/90008/estExt_fgenesh1_pg.C_600035
MPVRNFIRRRNYHYSTLSNWSSIAHFAKPVATRCYSAGSGYLEFQRFHRDLRELAFVSKLGEGGFGGVMLARHKTTGLLYSVKISEEDDDDTDPCTPPRKLSVEDRIALFHPFIVRMINCFNVAEKRRRVAIFDFVRGPDLSRLISHTPQHLRKHAAFYTSQLVLALEHLRKQGVLHRDLKPENILMCEDGYLKVVDFGLAVKSSSSSSNNNFLQKATRIVNMKTAGGGRNDMTQIPAAVTATTPTPTTTPTFAGTVAYASPEMILSGDDRYTDWWALGVLLYQMLHLGKHPFQSSRNMSTSQVIMKIVSGAEVRLPEDSDKNFCDVIRGLLCKDVKQRMEFVGRIKEATFFEQIDWQALENKRSKAPIVDLSSLPEYKKSLLSEHLRRYGQNMSQTNSAEPEDELIERRNRSKNLYDKEARTLLDSGILW